MDNDKVGLARLGGMLGGGAFVTAACCFLPLMLMAAGAGSGLIALVSKATVLALPLISLAALFLVSGWWVALRRRAPTRVRVWLGAGTLMTGMAVLIALNETAVIDFVLERI